MTVDLAPLMSSKDQTWNTPRWFIDRLELALGPVGLDPCSNRWSVVNAATEYRLDRRENGLKLPWQGLGLVFVNPPFGREIAEWMQRCESEDAEVVALVPARVDTTWWHHAYRSSSVAILWRGRMTFRKRESRKHGNAPFPSSVFYWGPRADAFVRAFATDGIVLR